MTVAPPGCEPIVLARVDIVAVSMVYMLTVPGRRSVELVCSVSDHMISGRPAVSKCLHCVGIHTDLFSPCVDVRHRRRKPATVARIVNYC